MMFQATGVTITVSAKWRLTNRLSSKRRSVVLTASKTWRASNGATELNRSTRHFVMPLDTVMLSFGNSPFNWVSWLPFAYSEILMKSLSSSELIHKWRFILYHLLANPSQPLFVNNERSVPDLILKTWLKTENPEKKFQGHNMAFLPHWRKKRFNNIRHLANSRVWMTSSYLEMASFWSAFSSLPRWLSSR
jgi:hypothetical protein